MSDVFEKRLRRAEALEREWPFAAELLGFFRDVYRFQGSLFRELERVAHPAVQLTDALQFLPTLLDLVQERGPADLRGHVARLKDLGPEFWERFSLSFHQRDWSGEPARPEDFFIRVVEETHRILATGKAPDELREGESPGRCPRCDSPPAVSLLREDKSADTVRRSLICPLCSLEWNFPRVLCPGCKEQRTEKLPRYSAQEIPWMRVEACDTCGKFLKSVDLTLNWEAEPVVDELASTPLDVIAAEHGYTKLAPNLAGI